VEPVKNISVQQALQFVADHPVPATDVVLDLPVFELVARSLFEIANGPDARVRGSLARTTRAQRMILDRLVGRRAAGTHPATKKRGDEVEYVDLTVGVIRS